MVTPLNFGCLYMVLRFLSQYKYLLKWVTVRKIHRKKGLQKERVPINIVVGHHKLKGALNDRRICRTQYNHKSGRCDYGNGGAAAGGGVGGCDPERHGRGGTAGFERGDPGAGRSADAGGACRLAECGDGDAVDGEQSGGGALPQVA